MTLGADGITTAAALERWEMLLLFSQPPLLLEVGIADIAIFKITIANDCVVRMVVNDI